MKKKMLKSTAAPKESRKELLVESLKLPKDMMMGAFMLSMTGKRSMLLSLVSLPPPKSREQIPTS